MTEREKLIDLLEEVKQKNRMLDAIEERLLAMRDLVVKSTERELLAKERQEIQREINGLLAEVRLLNLEDTIEN